MAGLGVWEWDVLTNVVTWSDELYRIYGLQRTEFSASFEGYLDRVHPADRARVQRTVTQAVSEGDRFAFDERIVRPDGSVRVLDSVGEVLRDEHGRALRMIGACMDVTDRRMLREQLTQQERLVATGALAAGVAHELNNPLLYVRAGIGRLQQLFASADSETRDTLADILHGVDRMSTIVRDLQAHARPGAVEPCEVSLAKLVRSTLSMVRHEVEHRAALRMSIDENVYVYASSASLGQAVLNILTNAVQAISPGRAMHNEIAIEVRDDVGDAVIEVRDSGVGMSPEVQARVFEPFFTTRPVGQGTGIGMYLVRRTVEEIGGTIQVRSRPGGTQVIVRIPSVPEPTRAPLASPTQLPERCRVLVIDDEPLVGRALARLLHDHDVTVVHSVAEAALQLAEDSAFDLLLCDLMMPDGLGDVLLADLQRRWPKLVERLWFMTGGPFSADMEAFAESHRERLLNKPFSRQQLLAILAHATR